MGTSPTQSFLFFIVVSLGLTVVTGVSFFATEAHHKYAASLVSFCILLAITFFGVAMFLVYLFERKSHDKIDSHESSSEGETV
jgi:preprotein translocase subunit SecG